MQHPQSNRIKRALVLHLFLIEALEIVTLSDSVVEKVNLSSNRIKMESEWKMTKIYLLLQNTHRMNTAEISQFKEL